MRYLLVLLIACDAGKKPAPPPSPPPAPAGDVSVANGNAAPTIDAAIASDAATATIDAGVAQATAPDEVTLTWVVYPPSVPTKHDPQILQQPVDLEVTAGGETKTSKLAPQFGGLMPYNQSACKGDAYPLARGELAKLTFYEGGAGGFYVKWKAGALFIYSWAQTDGLCGTVEKPEECPRNEKQVASMGVKATTKAKIVERIVEVDDKGVRKPFDCSAR